MSKRKDKLSSVPLYSDKLGDRQYSLASLREKIEDQFRQETSGRVDILAELDTRRKRVEAVRETADYVLATEYVTLPEEVKRLLVDEAVAHLFYFGPLDKYLRDEQVTEITMEGPWEAYVRRGFAETEAVEPPFDDVYHLEQGLTRLIAPAGAALVETEPFVEVGLMIHKRPVRTSLICPPLNPMYNVQIRLHPSKPIRFKKLVPNHIPEDAGELIKLILKKKKGVLIVGDVSVGKTTLLSALLYEVQRRKQTFMVERAQEILLPESVTRFAAIPANLDTPGTELDGQIFEVSRHHMPRTLAIDEIRGEEGRALWEALNNPEIQQLLVTFRGTANAARLRSAFDITIHRGDPSIPEEEINRVLLDRLPFVIALQHPKKHTPPRLTFLGQWVKDGNDITLQPLVTWNPDEAPVRTAATPRI